MFMTALKIMGQEQPLKHLSRQVLASEFNYNLALDSGSVYFYSENHFITVLGLRCGWIKATELHKWKGKNPQSLGFHDYSASLCITDNTLFYSYKEN